MHYTAQDWVTLLGAIGLLFGALAAGMAKILGAMKAIQISIDGRMEELIKLNRKASLAEGRDSMRPAEPIIADIIQTDNIATEKIVTKKRVS